MLIGYMRVSSSDERQVVDLQLDALLAAGVDERHLYQDKQSGGRDDRAGLKTCLAGLRAGDVLVVWKLDRLGRSLSHLVRILDDLKGRGVAFRSLTEGIDTTTSHGEFLYNLFGTLAQYERSLIRERVNAGLAAARRRGRRGGRPPAIDPETVDQIVAALDGGSSKSAVCRTFKVARSTLTDTLERIGWSGTDQPRPKNSKPNAQRPRDQERRKRLSREEKERASSLRQYLGVEVGVRRSAAQIGEQLPAHDRKNGRTGELVRKITSRFVAEGLAELALGPRGGAGWSLTKKGKALIDRAYLTEPFEDSGRMSNRGP
jgi:DNA invertase Pin-like site-specific DNA recombinase